MSVVPRWKNQYVYLMHYAINVSLNILIDEIKRVLAFEYEFEGKKHNYYPDFKLEDGTYVEIKGYSTSRWCAKLN